MPPSRGVVIVTPPQPAEAQKTEPAAAACGCQELGRASDGKAFGPQRRPSKFFPPERTDAAAPPRNAELFRWLAHDRPSRQEGPTPPPLPPPGQKASRSDKGHRGAKSPAADRGRPVPGRPDRDVRSSARPAHSLSRMARIEAANSIAAPAAPGLPKWPFRAVTGVCGSKSWRTAASRASSRTRAQSVGVDVSQLIRA